MTALSKQYGNLIKKKVKKKKACFWCKKKGKHHQGLIWYPLDKNYKKKYLPLLYDTTFDIYYWSSSKMVKHYKKIYWLSLQKIINLIRKSIYSSFIFSNHFILVSVMVDLEFILRTLGRRKEATCLVCYCFTRQHVHTQKKATCTLKYSEYSTPRGHFT